MKTGRLFLRLALTIALSGPAMADTRLFPDSMVVTNDRISVEIIGAGPDLIFIPGLASSRETWRAVAERLKARYRLHLVQVAGFAGEPARANAQGEVLVPTAEAIDAYIVAQKLAPATIVGHSLGGTMTLYLAAHHPDHLRKVMVVDALPFFGTVVSETATVESLKPMIDGMRAGLNAPSGQGYQPNAASMAYLTASPRTLDTIMGWTKGSNGIAVLNATIDDFSLDLRPALAGIRTPLMLVYPDYKPLGLPAEMVEKRYRGGYAAVKAAELVRIDNSNHFVMLDQPAQFDAALDRFLAR